ncbi:zinc finger protein 808-like [Gigantopelta aegis]|uniref:zinc finger protein 808-like n=1 Tax=Gigantopelta aegis TaxID=1735272 RepID=UPI001B88E267|nr:zinc finger protein 808-like [Gigantopelta aegis]
MENGKYVCEQCSYNTTRKYNIQRHIFKHSDLPVCRICNTKFMDSIHLINHMVTVHGQGGDARACCSVCGETFLSLNALRKHKQFVHLRKAKYHCKACDMFFDSRSRFDAHMSKHTGVAPHCCGKCGKGYRFKKNLLHHSMICTGKNVSYEKKDGRLHCRECGYITKWYTDIKRHWYQHNPENKHACSHCEKLYCSVLELQEHVNTAHLNLKFLCYGCGKKFNSRRALNRHASHAHENVYKYTCEVCAKRFYDKVKFDDHKDKHTGSKNHICHVCGLAYRYKPRLITHLKMHTSSENFLCNICEQRFNTMASLKNHMIGKHSIDHCYRCPWCSKEFKWSSSLSFHKRKTCQFQPNI